jgi:glutamate formiminotransferase / 5-formyltetrahydrofolate cyclo-ligase
VSQSFLLCVPNISEGSDNGVISKIRLALAEACPSGGVLDAHTDKDHGRTAFTVAAKQKEAATALLEAARTSSQLVDLTTHSGLHPRVGSLDVAPVVYMEDSQRGQACAEALTAGALIGDELQIPVFLYGELATGSDRVERSALRAGGHMRLGQRVASGEIAPDFGPARISPRTGAVLVTARPPLVAINFDLASEDVELAKSIASKLRESGGGPPGVRAIGLYLSSRRRAQVSSNVHDYRRAPLAELLSTVRSYAEVAEVELVGLVPKAAIDGLPSDVHIRGFGSEAHVIENALGSLM